jgi:hypothetical protein
MKPVTRKKPILRKTSYFALTAMMLAVFACGSDNDDDGDTTIVEVPAEEQQADGPFHVPLVVVNNSIVNNLSSTNNIFIQNEQVDIDLIVRGVPPGEHRQYIYTGNSCPTLAEDDTNQDGFVDAVEASQKAGSPLIPLDGDISTQEGDNDTFPVANENGTYEYAESASLAQIVEDLNATDPNPDDFLVKLPAGEDLNLVNRVYVVLGVPESVQLPISVASLPGLTAHQSVPIACGPVQAGTSEEAPPTGGGTGGTVGGTTGGATGGTTGGTTGGGTGGASGGTGGGGESCLTSTQRANIQNILDRLARDEDGVTGVARVRSRNEAGNFETMVMEGSYGVTRNSPTSWSIGSGFCEAGSEATCEDGLAEAAIRNGCFFHGDDRAEINSTSRNRFSITTRSTSDGNRIRVNSVFSFLRSGKVTITESYYENGRLISRSRFTEQSITEDPTGGANGGVTTGGETTGGETTGGETTGGETTGGETTGGETTGGETTGGETTGGETTGEATGGETTGGEATGGEATGGETTGEEPTEE